MQVLRMDMNSESGLKPVKASQHGKTGSKAGNNPGKNKKFAEIYEQLLALPQTAVSESKIKQLGSNKTPGQTFESAGERLLLLKAPGQGAGPDSGRSKTVGHQAKLIGKGLFWPAGNTANNVSLMAAGAKTDRRTGSTAKTNNGATIKLTGQDFKQLKAAEKKGSERAASEFTHNAAKPAADEAVKPSGQEFKQLKAAEHKGSERAASEFTHNAAKPAADATVKPSGQEFKQFKAAEHKGSERAASEFTHNAAKPAADEAVKLNGNQFKQLKAAEAKVVKSADRSISTETRPAADNEFKFIRTAVKNDSRTEEVKSIKPEIKGGQAAEARDIPGEVNRQLQPEVNNSQALEKTTADKAIMSKSQIDFIAYNLTGQIKNGTSSLEVNLKPEYLGKIKLLLQMNDGLISIRIIAQNAETLTLMTSSMPDIKESLEQQGIKLNNMSVDIGNQEKQEKQTGSGYREESKSGNYFREPQECHDNMGSREQNYLQSGILNILA